MDVNSIAQVVPDKVHNDYPSDNQFEKIMSLIDDKKMNLNL